ncbi:MAG: hypothetical protein O7A98_03295 [Acidobacteria bacterium]|nr:hypothetical protein [Acidobacteriota bacterium]
MGSIRHVWLPILVVLALGAGPGQAAAAPEVVDARSWIGREAEFEAALIAARVVELEPIGTGVTNPYRADVAAGGPIEAFAWKPITAGMHHGFYESYKSEVAAYELDKLLGLGMVPVTVERRIDGQYGAACMWVTPAKTFGQLGGPPKPPAEEKRRWNLQLTRAKMFDNLISNLDPNLGNWMVDPAWNLILIDHSRAFTRSQRMVHELIRVDRDLWERMLALDEETLTQPLGKWLGRAQIRSILRRRDRMTKVIARLVEEHGEKAVLVEASD